MSVIVGEGKFMYEVEEGWGKLPKGWDYVEASGVTVDSEDRIYVFNRGEHPIIIFDRQGNFLDSWGEGLFYRGHFLKSSSDGFIFCADLVHQTVRKFTNDGKLLMTLGTGKKYDADRVPEAYAEVLLGWKDLKQSAPPFNGPTDVDVSPSGEIYVSDGYSNSCIHKFSADGELLLSWGQPGVGPGQFRLPHGICVDKQGTVYVADRENSRIQIFSADGEFIAQWFGVTRPDSIFIDKEDKLYVTELGYRYAFFPWYPPPTAQSPQPCVSIWDLKDGNLISRWGGGEEPFKPGNFLAPHEICVDSYGGIYVSDMVSIGAGLKTTDRCPVQKFARIG